MGNSDENSGELLHLLFEGDAPDFVWERGDWELDPSSLTVRKSSKDQGESRTAKPEVREVNPPERVKAQDVDVVLERTESLSEEKKTKLKGKCHVRDCGKSVLALRDFNQRYHICGDHIKAPRILRNGRVERFCQQCSRFHAVTEFEGVKRSCRKQLERHNARRRKRPDAASDTGSKPAVAAAAAAWGSASATASGASGSGGGAPPGGLAANVSTLAGSQAVLSSDTMVAFMQNLFCHPQIFRSIKRVLQPTDVDHALEAYRASVLSTAIRQVEGERMTSDSLSELRIGLKLRGGLPDALPENLRQTVVVWLQAEAPQVCGCMRSGCVFVTLSIVLRHDERERAEARGAMSLLHAILDSDSRWGDKHLTLHVGANSIAYSQPHKDPVQINASEASFAGQLPHLTWMSTPVLVTDRETSIRLLVRGQNLHHIARDLQGTGPHGQSTPTTLITRCGHDDSLTCSTAWLGGDTAEIQICAPELSSDGCALVWLEAWSGAYLSPAIPLFVTSNIDLACRVENLAYGLMDGLRERVPFDSNGWRCCINMYLRLCARPRGLVRGLGGGGTSGAAPGGGWEQASTGHRQQPRDHQQHHGMTGWSGGSGYASQGHVGGASRSDSAAATPFGNGYQGMSQAPMQQVPAPAYAQQGWPQQPQPPQPSQSPQGWAAPTQQLWTQQPQPRPQMSPSVAAAFAAAAAAAAAASSQEAPAAKRQALQGAWAGYNHGFEHQEGQTPLQEGAVPPSVENSNVADVSYSQGFVGGGVGRGAHSTLEQTPFESGDLPSDVPDRRPADEGTQRDSSIDVPPSTDFSELFDSMFKE